MSKPKIYTVYPVSISIRFILNVMFFRHVSVKIFQFFNPSQLKALPMPPLRHKYLSITKLLSPNDIYTQIYEDKHSRSKTNQNSSTRLT